jgi:hypothetical protein
MKDLSHVDNESDAGVSACHGAPVDKHRGHALRSLVTAAKGMLVISVNKRRQSRLSCVQFRLDKDRTRTRSALQYFMTILLHPPAAMDSRGSKSRCDIVYGL